jgi:hypothetical protein
MKNSEMKARRDVIQVRLLEITAELREMKRVYVVDGGNRPFELRVSLEAEYAALQLEKQKLLFAINTEWKAQKMIRRADFTAVLMRLLNENGMSDLLRQAERISQDRAE